MSSPLILSMMTSPVLWFSLAIVLLDRFDIELPRGDSLGVSGAIVASALVVEGPVTAIAAALIGVAVSHLVRHHRDLGDLAASALVRLAALMGALFAWTIIQSAPVEAPAVLSAILVSSTYLAFELASSQMMAAFATRRPFLRLLRGNLRRQASMLAAQVSVAALFVLIYQDMQLWSLVPVVALLLLMRQSYALLLDMRETYGTTVSILVEAAEGQDSRLHGHAERTAAYARMIGSKLGLSVAEVERLGYCALLHDVDMIAESSRAGTHTGSSVMLEGVTFFHDLLPVLRVCDGRVGTAESESTLLLAMVVALASDIDVLKTPRVAGAHQGCSVAALAPQIPQSVKARTVSAAIELGFETPAVG